MGEGAGQEECAREKGDAVKVLEGPNYRMCCPLIVMPLLSLCKAPLSY